MPIAYPEGTEQSALEFCLQQLQQEKNPKARKELDIAISTLKAKIHNSGQDFSVGDTKSITST